MPKNVRTLAERIPSIRQRRNIKNKSELVLKDTPVPKLVAIRYRKDITSAFNVVVADTQASLFDLLNLLEYAYVSDDYTDNLEAALNGLKSRWIVFGAQAKIMASKMVKGVNDGNSKRFYGQIEKAMGVNLEHIIQEENLGPVLNAKIKENVSLIKSIPDDYFRSVETIVYSNTTQGTSAGGIRRKLRELTKKYKNVNIKRLARDQTQKTNAAITQVRQENLGVEEYIWRTSSDERVREAHKRNNGKRFRWDSPPKATGHPGHDIQCRCTAEAILPL